MRYPLAVLGLLVLSCGDADSSRWNDPPLPDAWPEAAPIAFVRAPYLQDPGDRRMVVMWRTAVPCQGLVEVESPQGTSHTVPTEAATQFEVALEDLPEHASDLTYRVACVTGAPESLLVSPSAAALTQPVPFRLAPAPGAAGKARPTLSVVSSSPRVTPSPYSTSAMPWVWTSRRSSVEAAPRESEMPIRKSPAAAP